MNYTNMGRGAYTSFESTSFSAGRIVRNSSGAYTVQYHITDHLGSVRASFNNLTCLQENSYNPYGTQSVSNLYSGQPKNNYLFNGKEQQTDIAGFGFYNYGARFYDPALGRWHSIDPLAEKYYSWSPYNFCVGNPLRFVDPDGRKIVDTNGTPITYSAQTGWSSNVTSDVKRIGTALMATPKGREMLNKMMNASHNITITIDKGKGDGKRNGYASTTRNGNNIGSTDIVIYEGMAEYTINKIQATKTALSSGKKLKKTPGEETQALLDYSPITTDEQMANVAAHEAEHATNKAANPHFESNDSKMESIANQTQIEVIKQTSEYRFKKLESIPAHL